VVEEVGPILEREYYLTALLVVRTSTVPGIRYALHTVGQYERWQQYYRTGRQERSMRKILRTAYKLLVRM
jgi:hypothetical protein